MKKVIKLTTTLLLSLFILSCANSLKKPDNDLKKSPCACIGTIYNSDKV
ncbi:hypothetical protein BSPWISOX_2959 [uncultured Gammaproteobacteria bacterium]|jgi:hypothetical protein|nr:hypothetical protein BSPWISOX_2959 [uncultured Gammaproteobacteria bacterium]